jgi:hypothetical protein
MSDIDTDPREKSVLEIEKLKAEVVSLRRANSWLGAMERSGAFLAILVSAAGIAMGLHQFNSGQDAARRDAQDRAAQELAARNEELKKTYWQEQKDIYIESARYAGLIAHAERLDAVGDEVKNFFALYWGPMSLLEHTEVERSMIAFGQEVARWRATNQKPAAIQNRSYELAHCMKQSLAKTWRPVSGDSPIDQSCPAEYSR